MTSWAGYAARHSPQPPRSRSTNSRSIRSALGSVKLPPHHTSHLGQLPPSSRSRRRRLGRSSRHRRHHRRRKTMLSKDSAVLMPLHPPRHLRRGGASRPIRSQDWGSELPSGSPGIPMPSGSPFLGIARDPYPLGIALALGLFWRWDGVTRVCGDAAVALVLVRARWVVRWLVLSSGDVHVCLPWGAGSRGARDEGSRGRSCGMGDLRCQVGFDDVWLGVWNL